MAGHSKWANIKHRKAAQDAKRGKIFTKLIRELTVAARMGGSDQESNPRLRDAVAKALAANMKKDTVENAIKRGSGAADGENYEELRYEGYGPAGVAVLVECLTDNRNRTVAEVRHAFSKRNGNLGTDGSLVVSSIGTNSSAPARINWQRAYGGGSGGSEFGNEGDVANLPSGLVVREGETLVAAEAFYDYEPVIFQEILEARTIYRWAVFRPRFSALTDIAP